MSVRASAAAGLGSRALTPGRRSGAAVWSVVVLMLAVAIVMIIRHGRDIPFAEDWLLVPAITGNEPSLRDWVLAQNNEHPVAAPKALYLLLLLLAGDFRVAMFFNAIALAGVAAMSILTVSALRGGEMRLTDAFFPIALLHLGHWDNLLWGWQIQFVLSVSLTCILLAMVVRWRDGPPTAATAAAAGVAMLLLPVSGSNGVVVAPAFALWALYFAVGHLRGSARHRRPAIGWILIIAASASIALAVAYVLGYRRLEWYPEASGPAATARIALRFLAVGFGPAIETFGIAGTIAGAGIVGAALIMIAAGARARRTVGEGGRMVGVALGIGALLVVAAAVSLGRTGRVEALGRLSPRYALLSAPLLVGLYLAAELYAGRWRRATQWVLFAAMLLLLPFNTRSGIHRKRWFDRGFSSFEADLRAGSTAGELAANHHVFLLPWSRELLESRIGMLEAAGMGPVGRRAVAPDGGETPP